MARDRVTGGNAVVRRGLPGVYVLGVQGLRPPPARAGSREPWGLGPTRRALRRQLLNPR